jgi:hypothetical protein
MPLANNRGPTPFIFPCSQCAFLGHCSNVSFNETNRNVRNNWLVSFHKDIRGLSVNGTSQQNISLAKCIELCVSVYVRAHGCDHLKKTRATGNVHLCFLVSCASTCISFNTSSCNVTSGKRGVGVERVKNVAGEK